jgi:hypothetical protein
MRRIATMMAGAVLALALIGPAVARAADAPPASDPGRPAHYDKKHHDQFGENNCNKFRDQCKHDDKCDCWYRSSDPVKSDPQSPPDQKDQPAPSQGEPPHSDHDTAPGPDHGGHPAPAH